MQSKTVVLGVTVLALQRLRELGIEFPRSVTEASKKLGVSRKAGYDAAHRIEARLEDTESASELKALVREKRLVELRLQVVTYERDHPRVRFGDSGRHLPDSARSLCVRLLREYREDFSPTEIARTIDVPLSSLLRWEREADAECSFPEKPDGRGRHRHATPEDEERVVEAFRALEQDMTLEEFATHYRSLHPDRALDRRTITKILQKHRLVELKKKDPGAPSHEKFQIFYPGVQASIDATECSVDFVGERGEETIKHEQEAAIDIASGTILGTALGKEETADGVTRVVVEARKECQGLLSVLADNGSANRSDSARRVIRRESEVGPIFTFPYHPRTNGHIEGLFGKVSRVVGRIVIDDSSRESIARSVVLAVWSVFSYLHNYSPRKNLGGLSPIAYLRNYTPTDEEVENARRELRRRQERSEALRQPHPRLSDEAFRNLVRSVIEDCRFEVEYEKALRGLLSYDTAVIKSAWNAFLVASGREAFDEKKRTFAYFLGIVRNKQKEIDRAKLEPHVLRRQEREERARRARVERELHEERTREERDIEEKPERVILTYAELFLRGGMQIFLARHRRQFERAFDSLEQRGENRPHTIDRLSVEIRSWPDFSEELKKKMAEMLGAESSAARTRRGAKPREGRAPRRAGNLPES